MSDQASSDTGDLRELIESAAQGIIAGHFMGPQAVRLALSVGPKIADAVLALVEPMLAAKDAVRDECERQYQAKVAELLAETTRTERAEADAERARALHRPRRGKDPVTLRPRDYCSSIDHPWQQRWPCPTIRALAGVTEGGADRG